MTHDYMTDWTSEEREATKGMPPNIAVGFVAARRGTDVRDVHGRYDRLKAQMDDLIKTKTSGQQVSEAELRRAFEKFSADFPSRTQEDS
jgi:hypothetical protein